ncbi:MAG: SpoIID/LytB domain-containing protein [Propionibacteriales bacterium]|nr:SpoIID/LytB domain-containing protein [Propionibacteriales bacterium]
MRTRIVLLLGLLVGFALVPVSPAQAAAEPWAAYDGNLKAVSQGNGHGKGLSQYGAQAHAKAGETTAQILKFYYPGTTRGTATGMVRVWITDDADSNVIVRPTSGLRVVDLGNGKSYTLPTTAKPTAWRLTVVAGKTRVNWLKDGVWHGYRPAGQLLTGVGEFRSTSNLLNLYYGGANHPYRGALRLDKGHTINVVNLDNYLKGVLPAEVFTTWEPAALQSQAVAARTYAAFERAANPNRSYHVYDDTRSQVYAGYVAEFPTTNAAVTATSGWAVFYAGKPAFTQFSSSNGGYTAKGGFPYLVGKEDPLDTAFRNRDLFIGPNTAAKIQAKYPALGSLQRVRVLTRDTDHRVLTVELDGAKTGTIVITGPALRSLIGLRSTYFSFFS